MADFNTAHNNYLALNAERFHNASFEEAHKLTAKLEGGYSTLEWDRGNYICDAGGRGISASGTSQSGKTAKDFSCSAGTLKFIGTNWGISAPVLADYLGRTPTVNDMKNLSYSTAKGIFKRNFWDKVNGDSISNQSMANILYDSMVQSSGMTKSALNSSFKELKISTVDSLASADTLNKINKANQEKLFDSFKRNRIEAYKKYGQTWGIGRTGTFDFIRQHPKAVALGVFAILLLAGTTIYYFMNRKIIEAPTA